MRYVSSQEGIYYECIGRKEHIHDFKEAAFQVGFAPRFWASSHRHHAMLICYAYANSHRVHKMWHASKEKGFLLSQMFYLFLPLCSLIWIYITGIHPPFLFPSFSSKLLGGTATRHQSGASSHYNPSLGPEKRSWNPRSLGPRDVGFPKGPFKSPEFFSCWKSNQPTTKHSADVSRISLNRCFFWEFSGGGPLNSFQVEGFSFFWGGWEVVVLLPSLYIFVIPSIGKARWGSDMSRHALLQQRSIDIPQKII